MAINEGNILNEGGSPYPLEKMIGRPRRNVVPMDAIGDRVPPHSNDAEMAVLGAMMLDKDAANEAIRLLNPDAFYRESHRIIYQAMLALSERNQPIDIITLNEELRRLEKLSDVGGSHYLAELNRRTPTTANIEHHARIVFEKALKRRMIHAAMGIVGACFSDSTDAFEELDKAEQTIFEISESRNRSSSSSMERLAKETVAFLEEVSSRRADGNGVVGIPTGLIQLDKLTGGFQRSDLLILAARPSMGKTAVAMSMMRNAAVDYKKPVAFFSLEMSAQQLMIRLISAEAKVNAHRLRQGNLRQEDWQQIVSTIHRLAAAPIYIDDTPALSIMDLRARSRLLKREHNIEMIMVDYLQLMHAPKAESREREISMISRGLKQLAKELNIPIVALSQLNRSVESRTDKRPMLSDLRESGCLTGDTLIALADTGRRVPLRELIGKRGFGVWALNEGTMRIERAVVSHAFSTGIKPVYRITTRLGRTIRATANHKFRSFDGWKRLDELQLSDRMALPRALAAGSERTMSDAELALLAHLIGDGCTLPSHAIQYTTREPDLADRVAELATEVFGSEVAPRISAERSWYQVYLASTRRHTHGTHSAITDWLKGLDAWGLRSHEKRIPADVFVQPSDAIALFLRHLWATDGCIRMKPSFCSPAVYYASSSEELARGVQSLLLRLGINAWLRRRSQNGKGRDQFHVAVTGKNDLMRFADLVGAVGEYKTRSLQEVEDYLQDRSSNTNRDVIPAEVWGQSIRPEMHAMGLSARVFSSRIETAYCGSGLYRQNISRERAVRIAQVLESDRLTHLATSDIYWDQIVSIEPDGEEEVFDLTVPGPSNFVADDIIVHNSIEQDSDVVMFVHRPEYYGISVDEENRATEGVAELIVGKQRNGPTGDVRVAFIKEFARFENLDEFHSDAEDYLPPAADDDPF